MDQYQINLIFWPKNSTKNGLMCFDLKSWPCLRKRLHTCSQWMARPGLCESLCSKFGDLMLIIFQFVLFMTPVVKLKLSAVLLGWSLCSTFCDCVRWRKMALPRWFCAPSSRWESSLLFSENTCTMKLTSHLLSNDADNIVVGEQGGRKHCSHEGKAFGPSPPQITALPWEAPNLGKSWTLLKKSLGKKKQQKVPIRIKL